MSLDKSVIRGECYMCEIEREKVARLEAANAALAATREVTMAKCKCGHTEVEHGSPPGACRTAPCLCPSYTSDWKTIPPPLAEEEWTLIPPEMRERIFATIADLQRQLQQAQEERDRANTVSMEVMGERDAAIERGVRAWMLYGQAVLDIIWWRKKAKAAEGDAVEQRALAEATERRMDGWATAMRQANKIAVGLRHDVDRRTP